MAAYASRRRRSLPEIRLQSNASLPNRHSGALFESDAIVMRKVTRQGDKVIAAQLSEIRYPYWRLRHLRAFGD